MGRITARNVETVAANLLDRLKRQGKVPANAYVAVTRAEPKYGLTWGAHVFQETDEPIGGHGRYENVPTVLDRALDGVTSTREAWLILTAILRTLDYPWEQWHPSAPAAAGPAPIVSVALDGDVSVDGDVYGRVESTSTGAWLAIAEGARNGSRHATRQEAVNAVAALAAADAAEAAALADEEEGTWAVDIATPATATGYGDTWTEEGRTRPAALAAALEYVRARRPQVAAAELERVRRELAADGISHLDGYHLAVRDTED